MQSPRLSYSTTRPTTTDTPTAIESATNPGRYLRRLFPPLTLTLPWLVLPNFFKSFPECPFDVANTDGFTVAVFMVLVTAVVEKVRASSGLDVTAGSEEERNTIANPGAGTGIWQVLAVWSHVMVRMFRTPWRRPSDAKSPPNVYKYSRKKCFI